MPSDSIVFVDTNVLLYAQDARVPAKRDAAQQWLDRCWLRRCGRLSVQVLNEFYANVRRVAPQFSVEHARAVTLTYRSWQPCVVDDALVDSAWRLQDRLSLSYWDALIVAAAQLQGARYLLSEDMQHAQQIDQLQIINPFQTGPDLLDVVQPKPAP